MRKPAKNEPLLNRLARGIGRAAGRLANATHNLPENERSSSPTNRTHAQTAKEKPPSRPKKKGSKGQRPVKPRPKRTRAKSMATPSASFSKADIITSQKKT